jgi:PKHD-type hydroxylase
MSIARTALGRLQPTLGFASPGFLAATSLHRVASVMHGARLASFFRVQSMVRDDGQRALLFDLDMAINRLREDLPADHPSPTRLTAICHNLPRRWADA